VLNKKIVTFGAVLLFVFYGIIPASADVPTSKSNPAFSDIGNSFAKNAIDTLASKGIINGVGSGQFNPTGKITRQDFCIILAKALDLDITKSPSTSTFSDVSTENYAYDYVEAAAKAGLIKGEGNGHFGSGQSLTRQDMAVVFIRALNGEGSTVSLDNQNPERKLTFNDSNDISDYAKSSVALAQQLGLIKGMPDNNFDPNGDASRQEAASVTTRFLNFKDNVSKLTGASFVSYQTIKLDFDLPNDKLQKEDIHIVKNEGTQTITANSFTLSDDHKSAIVSVSVLEPQTAYTVEVQGFKSEFTSPKVAKIQILTSGTVQLKNLPFELRANVIDENNNIVPNIDIHWATDQDGSISNKDGSYWFQAPIGQYNVEASYGDVSDRVQVTVIADYIPSPVDTTPPVVPLLSNNEFQVGDEVIATSNESGIMYLAKQDSLGDDPSIINLSEVKKPYGNMGSVQINQQGIIDTAGLSAGDYILFARDNAGNLSQPQTITLTDYYPPTLSDVTVSAMIGEKIHGTSSEDGWVYLIPTNLSPETITNLDNCVNNGGMKLQANADVPLSFDTTNLQIGSYYLYAVDQSGNISEPSSQINLLATGY
jgi:hypothetical protein